MCWGSRREDTGGLRGQGEQLQTRGHQRVLLPVDEDPRGSSLAPCLTQIWLRPPGAEATLGVGWVHLEAPVRGGRCGNHLE